MSRSVPPSAPRQFDSVLPQGSARLYSAMWWMSQIAAILAFRMRAYHTARMPRQGPVLLVANHQSHLDPPIVALATRGRRVRFIARASLFKGRRFGSFIRALGAFPLRDGEGDIAAVRAALACLDAGQPVLVFPEGSRCQDGRVGEFKRGAVLLLSRVRCPVVPIGIDGAFDAWPRHRTLPRLWGSRISVVVGEPIPAEELLRDGPEAALARLEREVRARHEEARRRRRGRPPID